MPPLDDSENLGIPDLGARAAVAATAVRRRRVGLSLALLTLVAAFTVLTACSRSDEGKQLATSVPVTQSPVTTVTWSFWGDQWEAAVNQRLVRAFEREHPDIRVETQHRPWGEYFEWLKAEWKAGRSPDVMFLNYIPTYVAMGELESLDTYIQRDGVALGDFYQALIEGFRVQGRLYGLPRDNDTKVIYYNRSHFAEAGIAEPVAGWTWDDLRAAALKLTRADRPSPRFGFGFEPDYWWLVWMWQRGCDVLDDPMRPTTQRLDSPSCVEALEFLQNLIHADRVTPPPSQLNTDDINRLFRDGRLSMAFGNHALIPWFAQTPNLSWDVAPLPRSVARTNVAGGAGFTIGRRSTNKADAWTLVRFLTGPKAQAMLAESGLITPARRSVREDNIFLRQQPYRADVFLAETELARPVPNFPGVTEMEKVMGHGLSPVWRGERAPADALRELAPDVQKVIDGLAR